MMKTRLCWVGLLALSACGEEEGASDPPGPVPARFEAVELGSDGKADGLPLVCDRVVHQTSPDVTVLSARVLGRATPSSNTVPSALPVDVGACEVLEDEPSHMSDCEYYEECRELTVDCRAELGRLTRATFLDTAVFSGVTYVRDGAHQKFYAEGFNCHVVEVVTATRDDGLREAKAMGLYFDRSVTFVAPEQAEVIGQGKLKNGDRVTLHRFAGLGICWAGSFSSSAGQSVEFKPFLVFDGGDACYVDWDQSPKNYAITLDHPQFDRWFDVLR